MTIVITPFIGKSDVVISTSPQFFNGLAGYFVSRIKRSAWVLEIRDIWPESIVAVGAIKNKNIIKILEWLERFAYRKADHIVAVTYAFREYISSLNVEKDKITVIRNGVDLEMFSLRERNEKFANRIGVQNKFVASYVGTHGMAHGLDVIIDTAEICKDDPNIVFLMIGEGAEKQRLVEKKIDKNLDNIIMLDQQPKEEMPNIWSVSDVSLVLLKKKDLFLTVIPSKIFESMAMRKPIILGVRGESQKIIEEAKAGICIEPENSKELAEAIKNLHIHTEEYENYAKSVRINMPNSEYRI